MPVACSIAMASATTPTCTQQPQQATIVGEGVRRWLDNNGYRGYPIWMTEAGHEYQGGALNLTDQQVADSYVRHCLRTATVRAQCHVGFKDTGSTHVTMRNPSTSTVIQAAFTLTNIINGKTMRQFSTHSDGRIWTQFADNTELLR
jgi:hypothetical protein